MTLSLMRNPPARVARTGVLFGITILVFIAYALPFFGLFASLGLPFVTHSYRRYLWPQASKTRSLTWSLVAWVGLWLPGLLYFFTPVFDGALAGKEVSTFWLMIPLCAPDSLNAVLLAALAAAVTGLAGLLGSVATRHPWPWVAAAWLAPWVHQLVSSQIPHEFLC
jgi:hypothetical protein